MPLGEVDGAKTSRKRPAEVSSTQPAAKQCHIEALPASESGSVSNSLWQKGSHGIGGWQQQQRDCSAVMRMIWHCTPTLSVLSGAAIKAARQFML